MAREGNFKLLRLVTLKVDGKDKQVFEPIKATRALESTSDAEGYMKKAGDVSGRIAIVDLKGIYDVAVKTEPVVTVAKVSGEGSKKKGKKEAAPETPPPAEPPAGEATGEPDDKADLKE